MAVVDVGHVWVGVHEWPVFVQVGVSAGEPVTVLMVMMAVVVDVFVLVLVLDVSVPMGVFVAGSQ